MSSEIEHIEYDRDINPYPSFGKKYNGEKAIISMTSWKMRILTCSKTIYSLLKQCPGFHIVLVLSEEEFPKMMDELPDNLKLFVDNELIEVLWVYRNYKSFKKVLPTMQKYKNVPVISADDDYEYIINYAQMLYDVWSKNKDCVITLDGSSRQDYYWCRGGATLYPIGIFSNKEFLDNIKNTTNQNDDAYMAALMRFYKIRIISLTNFRFNVFKFMNVHDEINALCKQYKYDEIGDINYFYNRLKK